MNQQQQRETAEATQWLGDLLFGGTRRPRRDRAIRNAAAIQRIDFADGTSRTAEAILADFAGAMRGKGFANPVLLGFEKSRRSALVMTIDFKRSSDRVRYYLIEKAEGRKHSRALVPAQIVHPAVERSLDSPSDAVRAVRKHLASAR